MPVDSDKYPPSKLQTSRQLNAEEAGSQVGHGVRLVEASGTLRHCGLGSTCSGVTYCLPFPMEAVLVSALIVSQELQYLLYRFTEVRRDDMSTVLEAASDACG